MGELPARVLDPLPALDNPAGEFESTRQGRGGSGAGATRGLGFVRKLGQE